ncbi:peptidyl-prolyl cis-trans isomerase cyp63 [Anaeramoeba ignava]|uniref:Peptidyl-prolyl cis-trans isomerase cyp63 n=1 Tax=Anaeramoeba ignava TaxID=1746090 RepID=A0A9Q0LYR4_ANAIG|nr:peptidyl-prolyl cis-trans isomerase cyp63 [Anaeramoeba ignava]
MESTHEIKFSTFELNENIELISTNFEENEIEETKTILKKTRNSLITQTCKIEKQEKKVYLITLYEDATLKPAPQEESKTSPDENTTQNKVEEKIEEKVEEKIEEKIEEKKDEEKKDEEKKDEEKKDEKKKDEEEKDEEKIEEKKEKIDEKKLKKRMVKKDDSEQHNSKTKTKKPHREERNRKQRGTSRKSSRTKTNLQQEQEVQEKSQENQEKEVEKENKQQIVNKKGIVIVILLKEVGNEQVDYDYSLLIEDVEKYSKIIFEELIQGKTSKEFIEKIINQFQDFITWQKRCLNYLINQEDVSVLSIFLYHGIVGNKIKIEGDESLIQDFSMFIRLLDARQVPKQEEKEEDLILKINENSKAEIIKENLHIKSLFCEEWAQNLKQIQMNNFLIRKNIRENIMKINQFLNKTNQLLIPANQDFYKLYLVEEYLIGTKFPEGILQILQHETSYSDLIDLILEHLREISN